MNVLGPEGLSPRLRPEQPGLVDAERADRPVPCSPSGSASL